MLLRVKALVTSAAFALSLSAGAQSYGKTAQDIRAGVIVIESAQTNSQPENYNPFVFLRLDNATGIKPAGWNFVNPNSTTQVTGAVVQRWGVTGLNRGGPAATGGAVDKASAPYWEVRLSKATDTQISEYDILHLSAYGYTALNSIERDRLRKFVDQGGILWVDVSSTTNFGDARTNTLPLPFEVRNVGPLASLPDPFNALMSNPYPIANYDLVRLESQPHLFSIDLTAAGVGQLAPIQTWIEPDYARWSVVAPSAGGSGPLLLSARIGDGFMVVTAGSVARTLNRVKPNASTYSNNVGYYAQAGAYDAGAQTAAKLVINMISLSNAYSQPSGGSRKTNSIALDSRPPLLQRFRFLDGGSPQPNQAPVIYNGIMFMSIGDRLYALDADPKNDLDGDGNADDGVQDYTAGKGYDVLWVSRSLGGVISPPTAADIPGAAVPDQVFVIGENGRLYAFDALQLVSGSINGNLNANPAYTVDPPSPASFNTSAPGAGPYAPTFHEGLLYIADIPSSGGGTGPGRIWVVDPLSGARMTTGTADWRPSAANFMEPTASPTIGYIPVQDNSGAFDKVLYYPGRPTGNPGPNSTASINSMWIGVRGEAPTVANSTATELQLLTRATRQGLRIFNPSEDGSSGINAFSNGVKITVIKPNGDPFTDTELATYFNGTVTQSSFGILSFSLRQALPTDVSFRLDYTLDLAASSQYAALMRGQLFLPDDPSFTSQDEKRRIIGSVAMSPRGTIYVITTTGRNNSDTNAGGSFYAFREDVGRGGFRALIRYDLFGAHQITLNQATTVNYPPAIVDNDPVINFAPGNILSGTFTRLTWVGNPAVRNGIVYVTALGNKRGSAPFAGFIPYTILFAFKAEPSEPEVRVGDIGDANFSIRQPDITRSSNKAVPNAWNEIQPGQYTYNRSEGVIRFDSLMPITRGAVLNAFSTSQPVVIRRPNSPDQLVEPENVSSRWSPLLWYSIMHGVEPTGGPVVTGPSVFVPGSSIIPNLDLLPSLNPSGIIYAWNGQMSTTDQFVGTPDGNRPWLKQAYQVRFNNAGDPIQANPNLLWPQFEGMRDMGDWFVRLRQSTTKGSARIYGLSGGEGNIVAWTPNGLYSYSKADVVVADENRIARFDASGNPLWIAKATADAGATEGGGVSSVKPLVRPVRAYSATENEVIVADPGGNRVVRLDYAGRQIRSLSSFTVDPANVPEGFKSGDPTTFSAPRDVAMYRTRLADGRVQIHYLVADSGNKRVVDIVDTFSGNTLQTAGVLFWHSPSSYSGRNFEYSSVQRLYVPSAGRYFVVAGIGSALPTRAGSGLDAPPSATAGAQEPRESSTGNGGVVIFDPADYRGNIVVNRIAMPSVPQDVYWNFNPPSGSPRFLSNARAGYYKLLGGLNSVTARIVEIPGVGARVALMLADSTGVYEVVQATAGGDWQVRWMLTNEAYRAIRRPFNGAPIASSALDFRAMYARRLDNGDVIVVNGYAGRTRGGNDFRGEVLQIAGDIVAEGDPDGYDAAQPNLGYNVRSIVLDLGPVQNAREIVLPVFADRR